MEFDRWEGRCTKEKIYDGTHREKKGLYVQKNSGKNRYWEKATCLYIIARGGKSLKKSTESGREVISAREDEAAI